MLRSKCLKRVYYTIFLAITALTSFSQVEREKISPTGSDIAPGQKSVEPFSEPSGRQQSYAGADSNISALVAGLRKSCKKVDRTGIDTAIARLERYTGTRQLSDHSDAEMLEQVTDLLKPYYLKNTGLALLYSRLGTWHMRKESYLKGFLNYDHALHSFPDQLDERGLGEKARVYNNIASVWNALKERTKALENLDKAELLARKQSNIHLRLGILQNRGNIFLNNEQFDSAYYYLEASYKLSVQYPDKHPPGCLCPQYTLANMAAALSELQRPEEALEIINKEISQLGEAYRDIKTKGFSQSSLDALNSFLHYVQGLIYFKKQDYIKAENILTAQLRLARAKELTEHEIYAHKILAQVYEATGQYKNANRHNLEYINLLNSRKEAEEKSSIVGLYYELEKEKAINEKKAVIDLQRHQIREKNHLILGAISVALLLAGILGALYRNHRQKHKLQSANLANVQQQQEIRQLQAKIEGEEQERGRIARELHDGIVSQLLSLKLNLNVLQSRAADVIQPYELNEVTLQLSEATEDLRRTAHNLMPDLLLQQGLTLSMATLCEQISKSTKVKARFQSYGQVPKLPQETELTLYRMVQELVQNTLKHAEASRLLVQLGYANELLSITVEDNGKGIPVTALQAGNEGAGLRNLHRRVHLLKGHMDIQSKQGRNTAVYLEFHRKDII